jgi:hypothetical protein
MPDIRSTDLDAEFTQRVEEEVARRMRELVLPHFEEEIARASARSADGATKGKVFKAARQHSEDDKDIRITIRPSRRRRRRVRLLGSLTVTLPCRGLSPICERPWHAARLKA